MPLQNQEMLGSKIVSGLRISLEIDLKDNVDGTKNSLSLSSIVEEILEDGSLLIQMPMHQGYYYPLPHDEPVVMKFVLELEVFSLPLQFTKRIERDSFVFAKMLKAGNIEVHQQRDCYRLPCSLDVTVTRPNKPADVAPTIKFKNKTEQEDETLKSRMINFSDGGLLLATDEDIQKNETFNMEFNLDQNETVEGVALRSDRIEEGAYLYRVAVQFIDVDKTQKQRFYKYIMNKQLEARRKRV